ncbi:hypothetical protein [Actinophytocola sp.]|uniref:hypothetical protein n=1 Tax=Actinophytocola sp. TaxID=1872138 RepID=UPI003D6C11F0
MLPDWWNGVELWMLGLPFPFQFALVVVVLVPLCLVVAWLIDRIVDHASAFFGPAASPEPPIGSPAEETAEGKAEEPAEPADVPDEQKAASQDERVPAESSGRAAS